MIKNFLPYRNIILACGIVLFLFISPTTAFALGINQVSTVAQLVLVLLIGSSIFINGTHFFERSKYDMYLVFFAFLMMLYMGFRDGVEGMKFVFFFSLFPFILSIYLKGLGSNTLKLIRIIILLFFVLECTLAIYERLFLINLFPYFTDSDGLYLMEDWAFRSSSFRGHPLSNALTVSIISGFILLSNELKAKVKLPLLIMGLFSLFCFNARGAILIWTLLLIIYFINNFKKGFSSPVTTLVKVVIALPIIGAIIYFLSTSSFGGRIFNSGVIDGSSSTRLDVFDFYKYISFEDLLLGNKYNYTYVMNMLGAAGVENSIIVLILKYGLIFAFIAIVFYFIWVKQKLINDSLWAKFVLIFSFLMVGMTNNSLAGFFPWCLFVICYYAFPRYQLPINKVLN